ncbi:DUF3102 domain-containing protein [Salipaludibacillus sp. CF4.18]|uniref:DUF3102 domain-containing protein n=1 Tax=Salipaludibacillus sp. CF4.18 TaxID=3373081 RepID=UPI003EE5FA35
MCFKVAGQAIFEIGKRLKHVKENDLVHGEYVKWLESIEMDKSQAAKFIKVCEKLGKSNVGTYTHLGTRALYEIATLPEDQREQSHEIPSTGETKTVDEMTVKELREVKAELKKTKEDMIIEDLISTNILQRGIGNVNPMKMSKCIVELERIYGIGNGSNQWRDENNFQPSKKQLSEQIGLTQQQVNNFRKLNTLIPELQDMVEDGDLKSTTAHLVWSKLSKEEQGKFFNEIGKEQISQMTQKQTQEYLKLQEEVEQLNFTLPNYQITTNNTRL